MARDDNGSLEDILSKIGDRESEGKKKSKIMHEDFLKNKLEYYNTNLNYYLISETIKSTPSIISARSLPILGNISQPRPQEAPKPQNQPIRPDIPAERVLARFSEIENPSEYEGPAVIADAPYDLEALARMNNLYWDGYVLILLSHPQSELGEKISHAKAIVNMTGAGSAHFTNERTKERKLYVAKSCGRCAEDIHASMQKLRGLEAGTMVGIAASSDDALLYLPS